MEPTPGRELSIPLRFWSAPARPNGLSTVTCLNCRKSLDIHQPDADLPDRMLATCPACRAWHLVDFPAGAKHVVIVVLPDLAPFRMALGPGRPFPGP